MTTTHHRRTASISEQAAEWYVTLSEPGSGQGTHRRFYGWLKKSPQHIEEFLAIAALEQEISEQPGTVEEVVRELAAAAGNHPVPLFSESGAARKPARRRGRLRYAWAGAACAAALTAAFVAWLPRSDTSVTSHRTNLGEQRSIALSDGSIVTLNTLSEATVHFGRETRRVTLDAGEALFEVARNPARPFVVDAGIMSLNVVGTRFSVYRKPNSIQVAVIEGTVNARSLRGHHESIVLHGGEGAVFTSDGRILQDEKFDVESAIAWTERRLVFDHAPLADVVHEFNRYNRMQLRIEDESLARRPITTVVNAHDLRAIVGFLQLQPDVEIDYGQDTIRIRTEASDRTESP